jgi:AcrR family transcriptional regulator
LSGRSRERLLDTAGELFYLEGVHLGVDAVCSEAGVSKKTMYQLFGSKDELIAASLADIGVAFLAALVPAPEDRLSARERILFLFERQDEMSELPLFRGCPFVNTATELKQPDHPGSMIARGFKQQMTEFFFREASAAGVENPTALAGQLTMAFDGAAARAVVSAQPLGGTGVAMAAVLLDAAGVQQIRAN